MKRRELNKLLAPHGLRLCSVCGDPCTFDEFPDRVEWRTSQCKRCVSILSRARYHGDTDYREARLERKRRRREEANDRKGYG